jgi:HAD superfamily hydrolase (TIGR01509 family)
MQEELKRLPANYWQLIDQRIRKVYKEELKAIAGTVEALQALKLPRCVASSSEPDSLNDKLILTDLKKFFGDDIFHGKMVSKSKPEPDLFLFALKKMGWNAHDCLVVEDSVYGVQAGRAAGLTVCGFLGGAHVLPDHEARLKEAGAQFLISDLRQLSLAFR